MDQPNQFDDPNVIIANILGAIKSMSISIDASPNKLKQAYGDSVLSLLSVLAEKAVAASGFKYRVPTHKSEDFAEEAEVDKDAEVTADYIDEKINAFADDEDEVFHKDIVERPVEVVKPMIDHTEWKLEVERVQPLLKVQIQNDNKDWRIHLEQIKNHHSQIEKSVGETREYLVKLDQEITESLEKISSRESYINKQFEPQTQEFRRIQELTSTLSLKHTAANETVSDVSNKLNNISQELDSVKSRIDDIGSGMTDSKPLANIKQGLVRLKNEIKQMDLRTGVIQHNLLNEKMKTKSASNVFQNSEIFAVHVL